MLRPKHSLPTTYVYNTLNQVITQRSPDGGSTNFWYDRLGRLVISQNAKQRTASGTEQDRLYSYTSYDSLGRITEVGQLKNTSANGAMTETISRDKDLLNTWLWTLNNRREQITNTVYDLPYPGFAGIAPKLEVVQRNLRNRVSYTSYTEGGNPAAYNNASFYTYDILGNVDTLLQDYGNASLGLASVYNIMNKIKNGTKKFTYQYDLISGKVNLAMYQLGWSDQWLHRYSYDAENRLTLVETSNDSLVWEKDARYEYYRHGPLARTVIGDQSVQGIDYAYTLQGWLKGVNSTGGTYDIGGDGKASTLNQYTGRDAYGFNLNYFKGEYKAINAGVMPFPDHTPGLPAADYRPLYNGNISSMAVYISRFETQGNTNGLLYNYKYDQLNRLKRQDTYTGFNRTNNAYQSIAFDSSFHEEMSYDANGNILNYRRNAQGGYNSFMDKLGYKYYPGTNQLRQVIDSVDANKYGSNGYEVIMDIDNQSDTSNYVYDSIGNLIQDKAEGLTSIKWNVYGKITEINRTASAKVPFTKITYAYDAQGNRISKITTQNTGRMEYTWYVRDAQGNLITTYFTFDEYGLNKDSLQKLAPYMVFRDQQVYGSSRLGMNGTFSNSVSNGPLDQQYFGYYGGNFYRGLRQYELTNHLGNVLTTISDKKLGVSSGGVGSAVTYYEPDIISANDYYPFGMLARVATSNTGTHYRYGFNGKENDFEAKGWQNQQDYGMRIYDPRVGRFLSVDPVTADYPWYTPYQFAGNTPIQATDLDGKEPNFINTPEYMAEYFRSKSQHPKAPEWKVVTEASMNAITELPGVERLIRGVLAPLDAYEYTNRNGNQKDPKLRAENEKQAKQAVTDVAVGLGVGKVLGQLAKGGKMVYQEFKAIAKVDPMETALSRALTEPLAMPSAGSGAGFEGITPRLVNEIQVGEFISTEPGAQGTRAVTSIQSKLNVKDLSVWSEPIFTTSYKGKTYILDGHNRLKAVSYNERPTTLTVQELSSEEARKMFPDKMKDIEAGNFDKKISEHD